MKTLIIIVTLIGLSAVVGAIVVGMKSFEGTVVDKPYETGLAWESDEKERASLGWKLELRTKRFASGGNLLLLNISDKEGKPLPDAEVSITVSRPSTSAHDKVYAASIQPGGAYQALVQLPLYGHWDVKARVKNKGRTVVFGERIFAEKD